MRNQFVKQLTELRQELISIYADIDLELHHAVDSLVEGDVDKAREVRHATYELDKRCAELEDKAYNLIVLQQPVASDLRLLQFIIYVNFNLQRMSNHVRNIAKSARRTANLEVPGQLMDLVASEAHLVYRVMGAAVEAIVESDLAKAASLPELDEPVDELYKQFYKSFAKISSEADLETATKVIMTSRMLERISDNAVQTGERLVFLLTGKRRSLDYLADLDEDELSDLYAVRGTALTKDLERDIQIMDAIPEIEETLREISVDKQD